MREFLEVLAGLTSDWRTLFTLRDRAKQIRVKDLDILLATLLCSHRAATFLLFEKRCSCLSMSSFASKAILVNRLYVVALRGTRTHFLGYGVLILAF